MHEIISTKTDGKIGTREIVCYVIGLCAGVFLLVYPSRVIFAFMGIVLIAAEIYFFIKSRAEHQTYLVVYEDRVEGMGLVGKSNKPVAFTSKYSKIRQVSAAEGMLLVETKEATYRCRCGDQVLYVSQEISKRL